MVKKPKYRVKTTKFLGRNIEVNLYECEFDKAFLAMTSKYEEKHFQKINCTICTKMYVSKNIIKEV